jgi:hypothetical protein
MATLIAIEEKLQKIDITKIVHYSNKINHIGTLNKMLAGPYLQDFIIACDLVNSMLSNVVRCNLDATSQLEQAEAIAYLDRSLDYLKARGIKDTAESRKKYIDIDPDVIKAKDLKAKTEAMVVFLKNKLRAFQDAHNAVKKIAYGDQQFSGEEGFR